MKRVLRTPSYDIWDLENGYFKSVEPNKRPSEYDWVNGFVLLGISVNDCIKQYNRIEEMGKETA